jgi:2-oxoglutarate dehydrogenase E1 component
LAPEIHPELRVEGADTEGFRKFYCGPIGVEFMHIPDPERRAWIQERMEAPYDPFNSTRVLEELIRADLFEQILHTRYLGNKRFSIKGLDAVVPALREMIDVAAEKGVERVIMAMSHRGRLNVVVNSVGRPAAEVFAGFEDVDPKSSLGGGDVKYHLGATGEFRSEAGQIVRIHLVTNSSHLEDVDPVALGRCKARQTRVGERGQENVLPILLHGDAAFAGQGILAEVLNLASLPGFRWEGLSI